MTPQAVGQTKAVVTGHSRGIGAGIAAHLLERGIPVLGISRTVTSTEDVERAAGNLKHAQLDLADSAAVTRWLAGGTLRAFLADCKLALLVNNAGLLQPIGPLEKQDPASVSRAVAINVAAALALSAAFAQATNHASERRILHVSSGAGRKPYAGWSVYCATKAALDHHARCVALDGSPRLRICSLAPGVVDTDMQAEVRASTEGLFPDRERFVAMKREGQLKDAGATGRGVVELLLSDAFGDEVIAELPR